MSTRGRTRFTALVPLARGNDHTLQKETAYEIVHRESSQSVNGPVQAPDLIKRTRIEENSVSEGETDRCSSKDCINNSELDFDGWSTVEESLINCDN